MIVVSTHLDDAVWSAHGLIREHPDVTVVTICAGIPPETVAATQFDTKAGFASAADAMRARRAEDHAAAEIVGFNVRHLDGLVCNYGPGPSAEAIAEVLRTAQPGEMVVGPLGLRHPDHEQAAAAFAAIAADQGLNAWVYEDLPYAYTWPADLAPALARVGCGEATITRACAAAKLEAVNAYESQIKGAHIDAILAPERYHPLPTATLA